MINKNCVKKQELTRALCVKLLGKLSTDSRSLLSLPSSLLESEFFLNKIKRVDDVTERARHFMFTRPCIPG